MVIADSRYHAEDGAELVAVEYDPLPAVVDPADSLNNPPAKLYENWEDNVYFHDEFSNGDVAKAFTSAAGSIKRTFTSQRHTGTPLETRGIIADWDPGREQLVLQWNHQDIFVARAIVATVLGLPQAQIRITAPDNGGCFGVKLRSIPKRSSAVSRRCYSVGRSDGFRTVVKTYLRRRSTAISSLTWKSPTTQVAASSL